MVQKPISPAYKEILDKLKNCSIKHTAITVKHDDEAEVTEPEPAVSKDGPELD